MEVLTKPGDSKSVTLFGVELWWMCQLGLSPWLKMRLCGWLFGHSESRQRPVRDHLGAVRTDEVWRECYCGAVGGLRERVRALVAATASETVVSALRERVRGEVADLANRLASHTPYSACALGGYARACFAGVIDYDQALQLLETAGSLQEAERLAGRWPMRNELGFFIPGHRPKW